MRRSLFLGIASLLVIGASRAVAGPIVKLPERAARIDERVGRRFLKEPGDRFERRLKRFNRKWGEDESVDRPTPVSTSAQPATDVALNALEQEIVTETNRRRAQHGLSALSVNPQLMEAARLHASNMARLNRFAHELPAAPQPTLEDRIKAADYPGTSAGENLAYKYHDARAVVDGWMRSPGHRENILTPEFREIGVSLQFNRRGEPFICQVLGQP